MKTKKELRDEYKEMKFKKGVFQIQNTENKKIYIDSSADLDAIFKRLKFQLNCGNHPLAELQKDWKEFGEDKFEFEILSEIKENDTAVKFDQKELKVLEQMFLDEIKPFDEKGYNKKKK
ncbi:group I intron endonuclease [Flavobacterium nitrogenifigens]|uniref:Group I intron endonuclease n=2 Tax=Flavobacterium TaxID=237 RepID=A0A7W7N6K1_9FLAO|nr:MULTISPECIES: GIY-YIG nuclease family protein [Flavobacterium]MBB4800506.1 group I intron endonuclease [Flavobacterium nitrogenifigens]MBB6385744.1 group I intron endonuclease [Flavobacterium notoginsengisoli]